MSVPTRLESNGKGFGVKSEFQKISLKKNKFNWSDNNVAKQFSFALGERKITPIKANLKSSGTLEAVDPSALKSPKTAICDSSEEENISSILASISFIPEAKGENYKYFVKDQDKQVKFSANASGKASLMQKALKYCLRQQLGSVAVLGASGLRDDHQLANLSILDMYAEQMDLIMVSNYGLFSFISDDTTFASIPGQEVSVFSFDGQAVFSFEGLQYPVHNRRFTQLWEGSLNKALGERFTVKICDGKGMVFREFR